MGNKILTLKAFLSIKLSMKSGMKMLSAFSNQQINVY